MDRRAASIALAVIDVLIVLLVLIACLLMTFGCEAINVSSDPFAVPVSESVYDTSPPTTPPAADETFDLFKWWENLTSQPNN